MPKALGGVRVLVNLAASRAVTVVGDGKYLSTQEAPELSGDSESTIRRLFDDGELDGYRTERGGHRRILRTSLDEFLAKRAGGKA